MKYKIKKQNKIKKITVLLLGVVVVCSACQKTPQKEYIVNKEEQSSLISDYETEDEGIRITEQLHAPEHIDMDKMELNAYTTLMINADVSIPEISAIPVYSVAKMTIDSAKLEEIASALFDGGIYRLNPNEEYIGVNSLKEEIADLEDTIQYLEEDNMPLDEEYSVGEDSMQMKAEELEQYRDILQERQLELYQLTEQASEDVYSPADYIFDTYIDQICVSIDDDGKNYMDYEYQMSDMIGDRDGNTYELQVSKDNELTILYYHIVDSTTPVYKEYFPYEINTVTGYYTEQDNDCEYTLEEAKALCLDALNKMGITDMGIVAAMNITAYESSDKERLHSIGQIGYEFYCYRTYNGLSDTYEADYTQDEYNWCNSDKDVINSVSMGNKGLHNFLNYNEEKEIVEHCSSRELVRVRIDNYGLDEIVVVNPMETGELLAENVVLMDFEQMLEQTTSQIEILYSDVEIQEGNKSKYKNLSVGSIEMHYACMQSPYEEGYTMIPVWDFKTEKNGKNIITINAIDGSIFQRLLGY